MRSPGISLLLAAAIFLGLSNALSTVENSNLASVSKIAPSDVLDEVQGVGGGEKRQKRRQNEEEDRALNLNFGFLKNLKQKVPGADALKAAKATLAAKRASAAAKKAAKKAEREAEKLKLANMFKITGERDDQIFPKFDEWFTAKIKDYDVTGGLMTAGKSRKEAADILSRYREWVSVKTDMFLFP